MRSVSTGRGVIRPRGVARVEPLEPRALLDAVPAGPEFQVNTLSNDNPRIPAVAADADGDFVAVWRSYDGGVSGGANIVARRFDAQGVPKGPQFQVSQAVSSTVSTPSVAMDDRGDFVVVWSGKNLAGASGYLNARRYDAAGTPLGDQFVVTSGSFVGSVAMDADGDFAIASGSTGSLYVRRYSAAGTLQGNPAFLAPGSQLTGSVLPSVGMDDAGNYIVAWQHSPGTNAQNEVHMQRFNAAGVEQGPVIVPDPGTPGPQGHLQTPQVGMDDDGDIVVTWYSNGAGGLGTYARLYTPAGEAKGPAFKVFDFETHPAGLAVDADGDFVVTAECREESPFSDAVGVCARRFGRDGTPQGPAFRVNTHARFAQESPAVASADSGDFVVVWQGDLPDGVSTAILGQRYKVDVPAPPASVVGRYAFYGNSSFDDPGAFATHRGAIATDKSALLPGQSASFANVTSYDKGLNGLAVDIAGLPRDLDARVTAADFDFGAAPAPLTVTRLRGGGANGSDRVFFLWADYTPSGGAATAVANGWLRATVRANGHTALAAPDVFSFGNLIGETGDGGGAAGWRVSALDVAAVKHDLNTPTSVTSRSDFNRDGRVNALDVALVKRNLASSLSATPAAAAIPLPAASDRKESGSFVAQFLG